MALITVLVEPHRVTRVLFDCRDAAPDLTDQRRIEQATEESIALAQADEDASAVVSPRIPVSRVAVSGAVCAPRFVRNDRHGTAPP
jgi:hypothetical protein